MFRLRLSEIFSHFACFSVQFDFDLEEFDSISENAQDFISCLLKKSPRTRLDASQCLEHRNAAQRILILAFESIPFVMLISSDIFRLFFLKLKFISISNKIISFITLIG